MPFIPVQSTGHSGNLRKSGDRGEWLPCHLNLIVCPISHPCPVRLMGTLLQIALARIIHELVLRDCEDERANSTSQGELVLPVPSLSRGAESKEHPRTPGFRLGEPTARREGRSYYSRSLRSAQSRTASGIYDKRVPSFTIGAADS